MLCGPCFNAYSLNMMRQNLPSWVAFWLLLSSIICAIDAFFVLLRPHTLPGGKWNYLFKPYNIYIQVDARYKDLKDAFVIGQSWMNIVEVCLNIVTFILHRKSSVMSVICGIVVSTMTCAKTILFTLMATQLCTEEVLFENVDWPIFAGLFVIPNSIWIVVPFLCIVKLSSTLINNMEKHKKEA